MHQFLELGFYISFSGTVTFPKAEPTHDCARQVPEDRFLVETIAPSWPLCPDAASATSRPSWLRWRRAWLSCVAEP